MYAIVRSHPGMNLLHCHEHLTMFQRSPRDSIAPFEHGHAAALTAARAECNTLNEAERRSYASASTAAQRMPSGSPPRGEILIG